MKEPIKQGRLFYCLDSCLSGGKKEQFSSSSIPSKVARRTFKKEKAKELH